MRLASSVSLCVCIENGEGVKWLDCCVYAHKKPKPLTSKEEDPSMNIISLRTMTLAEWIAVEYLGLFY